MSFVDVSNGIHRVLNVTAILGPLPLDKAGVQLRTGEN